MIVWGIFLGVPATPPARWAWWHRQLGVVDVFWGHLFWARMKKKDDMNTFVIYYILDLYYMYGNLNDFMIL